MIPGCAKVTYIGKKQLRPGEVVAWKSKGKVGKVKKHDSMFAGIVTKLHKKKPGEKFQRVIIALPGSICNVLIAKPPVKCGPPYR